MKNKKGQGGFVKPVFSFTGDTTKECFELASTIEQIYSQLISRSITDDNPVIEQAAVRMRETGLTIVEPRWFAELLDAQSDFLKR